jgi:hypothetical protein
VLLDRVVWEVVDLDVLRVLQLLLDRRELQIPAVEVEVEIIMSHLVIQAALA